MNELVTCGVTAFNSAESIERAIRSAIAQHYRPIEIVVVDDSSYDDTANIVARLAARHSAIRFVTQERNGGVAASRNRIIQEANGEFIAFFDDDDVSRPERLTVQLKRILDYERSFGVDKPIICHSARIIKDSNGHEKLWRALGEREGELAPEGAMVARAILGVGLLKKYHQSGGAATCSQMARRSVFEDLGGFDVKFRRSEDDDFIVRAALVGAHFVGVASPLVVQTLTATSDKGLADQRYYGMMLLEKHQKFLRNENSYRFAYHYFQARYDFMAGRYRQFIANTAAAIMNRPGVALYRLLLATRNLGINRHMGRFYRKIGK